MGYFILETASIPLLDLGIAISATGQDADKSFMQMKEAINSIVERYESSKIRYALLSFGTTVTKHVEFTRDLPDADTVRKSLGQLKQPAGEPNLQKALEEAKLMFDRAPSRPGARKVLVVMMDSMSSSEPGSVKEAAKSLEDSYIRVVAVAIGPDASPTELEKVTTNKKLIVKADNDENPSILAEDMVKNFLKSE